MAGLWIIIALLCLLTLAGSILVSLTIQHRWLDSARGEREAWQQAQEAHLRQWEMQQSRHMLDAEKKLADLLKETRQEWRSWSAQMQQNQQEWQNLLQQEQQEWQTRAQQEQQAWLEKANHEKELARLPRVDEMEIVPQAVQGHAQPDGWRPPALSHADLHGHDLSHRYLKNADLREANLAGANLYMADLSGTNLAGANLEQASLIGADLSDADLRGADLAGANLLVADLRNAILYGANLVGVSNLTPAQLQLARYDSTTILDSAISVTLPEISSMQATSPVQSSDAPGEIAEPAEQRETVQTEDPREASNESSEVPVMENQQVHAAPST